MTKHPSSNGLKLVVEKGDDYSKRWRRQYEVIRMLNDRYKAYITVFEKPLASSGFRRKLLRGASIAVKDVFHVKGFPTTAGSKLLARNVSESTAYVVERLMALGGVVNGKTNLHEFAFGVSNRNPHYGDCLNPYDAARVSGGSSGGSAVAVSLGMCDAALGSDTAGSVRIPASFCGVVGFKPSRGLLSTKGLIPLSWSLDTVGVLTKNVWDAALLVSLMSDRFKKPLDIKPLRLEKIRLGIPRNYFLDYLHEDVEKNFEAAVSKAETEGCRVVKVFVEQPETAARCRFIIVHSEAAAYHLKISKAQMSLYSEDVKQRITAGLAIPASAYLTALRARKRLASMFRKTFKECDFLILPTTIIPAHRVEEEVVELGGKSFDVRTAVIRNTELFNVYGTPALSIPCGFTGNGLPTGLQVVGDFFDDVRVLRLGLALQNLLSS
ncbi:MAG: amidase [Candidatus Caldarchaeum sp.]|uniref:Amidase n=1 Tax=Caldiarchaeum subterraneum TaxID=311458 RepID=A0A7J3VTG4_CALS0